MSYNIMPDGTVKHENPFFDYEVWSVPGRANKPRSYGTKPTVQRVTPEHPERVCSFCETRYFKMTIDGMKEIVDHNRFVRYVCAFQNWLQPAGASFDHLHKQLVGLDDWGALIGRKIELRRNNENVFNEFGVNYALDHNLVFLENDFGVAYAGIGHRYPTVEIHSKSENARPYEHTDEEIYGMSELVHAIHAATGSKVSANEEWYYTPVDSVETIPWHIYIIWRINVPAGFEGGTNIYINPLTPVELRDRLVPRLFELRDEGSISNVKIAEECDVQLNPLRYFIK